MISLSDHEKLFRVGIANRVSTPFGRAYDVDGALMPSVTTVLEIIHKPAVDEWIAESERTACIEAAAKLYDEVWGTPRMAPAAFILSLQRRIGKQKAWQREIAKANDIGTQAHKVIEYNLRKALGQKPGRLPKVSNEALWSYARFTEWYRKARVVPRWVEVVVWSKKHCYAGTADLVAHCDYEGVQVLAMIDFKTSPKIWLSAKLQVAAYGKALEEMGHPPVDVGMVVRLPKVKTDPEFEVAVIDTGDMDAYFETFLSARALWKAQQMEDAA